MKYKVLYLANIPAPYAVEYFTELGKICELTVLYERRSASDRDSSWRSDAEITYEQIFLEGRAIGTENSWCPSVVKYLNSSYDAIIIGTYSTLTAIRAMRYLKRLRIPYIISSDGGFIAEGENGLKKKLKTSLIGNASGWISSGKLTNEYLEYYGARKEAVYIYPYSSLSEADILSTPISKSDKDRLREELGLVGENIVVGVGQFIHRKGWDVLVKAVTLLNDRQFDRNTHYYIIGGTEENFKKQLSEDGINPENIPENIHTVGFLDKETVFKYYRAADLFVLPTREDIWGLVINEAMANALPVVTTDRCIAGLELVKNGANGFIFKSEDSDELAKSVELVLGGDRAKMGAESAETIRGYTYIKMAERTIEIIEKLKG